MTVDMRRVEEILERYPHRRDQLIQILQDINSSFNYLPPEALRRVSEALEAPLSRVYGVARFYAAFSLEPRGRNILQVCEGTACHVRGALQVGDELKRLLDLPEAGGTTADMEFTLLGVNCVGACALGPVIIANGEYHGHVRANDVGKLVRSLRKRD